MRGRLVRSRSPPQPNRTRRLPLGERAEGGEDIFHRIIGVGVIDEHGKRLAAANGLKPARGAGSLAQAGGDLVNRKAEHLAAQGGGGEGVFDVVTADQVHADFGLAVGCVENEMGAGSSDGRHACLVVGVFAEAEANDVGRGSRGAFARV